jgi:hypothetical protein
MSPERCARDLRILVGTMRYLLLTGPMDSHVE